ncbi:MAG: putative glycoprotein [Wenzhou bat rhabdovirus 3]|nr:MAG: putative glycoprotein [Wenzhou bat rhabdovirus 3]
MKKTRTTAQKMDNKMRIVLVIYSCSFLYSSLGVFQSTSYSNRLSLTHPPFDHSSWVNNLRRIVQSAQNNANVSDLRRQKRSVSVRNTYPVCPPLNGFEIVNYEDLRCPDLFAKQEEGYQDSSIKMIRAQSLVETRRICTCDQKRTYRYCFKKFFDSDEKNERSETLQPTVEHCQTLCDEMLTTNQVKKVHGMVPDYQCWWMKGTTMNGVTTTLHAIDVKVDLLSGAVTNQFIRDGTCQWGQVNCRFSGGAMIVFPSNSTITDLSLPKEIYDMDFMEKRFINSSYMILRAKISRVVYTVYTCCIRRFGGCILPSIRGDVFWTSDGSYQPCKEVTRTVLPALSDFGVKDVDLDELQRREHLCHLTKQSVLNSVKVKVPIQKRLLQVFNDFEENNEGLVNLYYTSNGALILAKCYNTVYESLRYQCPDVWRLTLGESTIGCYDARAGIAFVTGCKCYENNTVSHLMGRYVVKRDENSKLLVAEYRQYPESSMLQELAELARGYKEVFTMIESPTGIIIYDDPIMHERSEQHQMDQEYGYLDLFSGLWQWVDSFKRGFIIALVMIAVCVIAGVIAYFYYKNKTGGYKQL